MRSLTPCFFWFSSKGWISSVVTRNVQNSAVRQPNPPSAWTHKARLHEFDPPSSDSVAPPVGLRTTPFTHFLCSILYILYVVNFAHLDGLVQAAYDWCPLDEFPELIEGADPDDE